MPEEAPLKKFLIKAAALAVLVGVSLAAAFVLPVPHSEFLSAILNKRDLLKPDRKDRIIFVGGSGLLDGLDSAKVEAELGRPVVNMGLYAGFGISSLLREIGPYLRPGDTVVIIPEYGVIFDSVDEQARKWVFALDPGPNLRRLYGNGADSVRVLAYDSIVLLRSKLEALPKVAREALRTHGINASGYAYYSRYFNPYGDSLRTMRAATPGVIEQMGERLFADDRYRNQSLESVNAFCREEREAGVRSFFLFPAYPTDEYRRQEEGMRQYEARLRKELACPILGKPEDFLYPYSFFTNTVNHINNQARTIRTAKVIELLRAAMKQSTDREN